MNHSGVKSDKLEAVGFTDKNGEWKALYEQKTPFEVDSIVSIEFDGVTIEP